MNGTIKGVIGFILGALVGGAVAYVYQDRRLSKKFEEELKVYQNRGKESDEEKNEANDVNEEDQKADNEDSTNIPQDAIDAAKRMQEGAKKAKEDRETKGLREKSKTNYSKLTRDYGRDGFNKNRKEDGENMSLSEELIKNEPYYITQEEFIEWDGKDGYRAMDLFYNSADDTISNENGEIFEDAWMYLGRDIPQDLYDGKGPDEVYVKNDHFKEVYCIARQFML